MKTFHGYWSVSYSGILLFGIIQGVCVLGDETVHRTTGSSLILPLGYQNEHVHFAEWRFSEQTFVSYSDLKFHKTNNHQFKGRLKIDNISLSVKVEALQVQDSGPYQIVVDGEKQQLPTKTIHLKVHAQIENVNIQINQTWLDSVKACDVHLQCQTYEDQNVNYTWSGYWNGSGHWLHFTFLPTEGDIILTCTAANRFSNGTDTKTLKCGPEYTDHPYFTGKVYVWAATGAGAALVLLVALIALTCWWRAHKEGIPDDCGNTVYAYVDGEQKNNHPQNSANLTSIYETVDDLRITSDKDKVSVPQSHTLYAKVTFPQSTTDTSSPYQHVL